MRYAKIENEIVTNVIVADEEFAKNIGYVFIPDDFGIGDNYTKGAFSKQCIAIGKVRENALTRISGKCSGAIYQGVDIGELHYNFTATTQTNLETIARRISEGTENVLYRADNELSQRVYTCEEITAVIDTKDEWIAINTNYYEQLKVWINREIDIDTLNAVDYGSILPDDLMQELATKLASIGIDISKYSAMLGG